VALVALAGLEVFAALRSAAPPLTEDEWRAVAEALPEDAFPVVGTTWLGPTARQHVAAFAEPDVVGAPDLRGHARIAVLSLANDTSWRRRVAADLGLPTLDGYVAPTTTHFGALALHVIDVPDVEVVTDSLAARREALILEAPTLPTARCKTTSRDTTCSIGAATFVKVQQRFAEIDHTPRHCTTFEFDMQGTVRLRLPSFTYGTRLIGHVGVHDFNQRLRNEASTTLSFTLPGGDRWTATHTDRQGWAPFELATEPGEAPLLLDVTVGSPARFDDFGDVPSTRTLCLDLRATTKAQVGAASAQEAP
jgi:hypothetical protein